ncbi:right-handed parallel beta-helix repeat-containing protein [Geobacter pickeringii]|uniref:Right handed beta helix domain-containing protein n=1 Tax=Geobacter pickeringii TaxID=345632 RepID=A0A0B5BD52_9BACT|nr:right-handed parallel beta-helix repeat-containing protein [Geobacter pickeringii]AJE03024.1 hypothetical protein GPICK_06265 [Geobacter pickeringii]
MRHLRGSSIGGRRGGLLIISCAAVLFSGCGMLHGLWGKGAVAPPAPTKIEGPAEKGARPVFPPVVSSSVASPKQAAQNDSPQHGLSPTTPPAPASETAAAPQAKPFRAPERAPLPGATRIAPPVAVSPNVPVYRDTVLTEDTVWRGEVVVEGSVTVSPQTTLTVEPGAVVRFRRTSAGIGAGPLLLVQGRLVARGSADSPVRFTSFFPEPQAGDWEGIVLLGSEKKNALEHTRIEGAAVGIDALYSTLSVRDGGIYSCGTGGRFQDSIVSVSGGEVAGCDVGVEFAESEADIRDASFGRNRAGIVLRGGSLNLEGVSAAANDRFGLAAVGGRIRVERSIFDRNGTGLVLDGCEGGVSRGRMAGNREFGIVLTRSRVKVVANEIADNEAVGLRVDDGKGVAWGNVFARNGRYDLYNAGSEEFRAMANWWGEDSPVAVGKRVFGAADEPGRGRVLLAPVLRVKPLLPALNYVAK